MSLLYSTASRINCANVLIHNCFRVYDILILKEKSINFVIYKIQITKSFLKIIINVSCVNSKNRTWEKIFNNWNHLIVSVLHVFRVSSFSSIVFLCLFASIYQNHAPFSLYSANVFCRVVPFSSAIIFISFYYLFF